MNKKPLLLTMCAGVVALATIGSLTQENFKLDELMQTGEMNTQQPASEISFATTMEENKSVGVSQSLSVEEYEKLSEYGPLPESFDGSNLPVLRVDGEGNLIVGNEIRHLINYFYVRAGTENRALTIDRIREYLTLSLPENASQEALEILESFIAYQTDAHLQFQVMNAYVPGLSKNKLEDVSLAISERKRLREVHFSDEVYQAFFADEDRYDEYSLLAMSINQDSSLSPEEKSAALASAEMVLSPKTRESVRNRRLASELENKIAASRTEPNGEEVIYQLRKSFYGEEIATNFRFLESHSNDWQEKVDAYRSEKQRINSDGSLDEAQRKIELKELANRTFSEQEKKKFIYQEIAALQPEPQGQKKQDARTL